MHRGAPGPEKSGRGPASGEIRGRRLWILTGGALGLFVVFAYLVRHVLLPFVLAILLAYLLAPAVDRLEAARLRRGHAILLCYGLTGLAVAALVAGAVPEFLQEVERVSRSLPAFFARADSLLALWQERVRNGSLPPVVGERLAAEVGRWQRQLEGAVGATIRAAAGAVSHLTDFLLAPVIAYYLLAELPRWRALADRVARGGLRRRWWRLLSEWDEVLAGFVRGQLLVAGAVGVLTAAGLALLGVPYALLLGTVAAVTDLVPYFGPFLGALPAVLLAAGLGWQAMVKVALLYAAVQLVESSLLVPVVVGRRVRLHPLAIILALLIGGRCFGLAGFILAVPVAACLRVLARWFVALVVEEGGLLAPARTNDQG